MRYLLDYPVYPGMPKGLRMNDKWAPGYLGKWLFRQDKLWITAAGEAKQIRTMDREHALNTLLMLERVVEDLHFEHAIGPLAKLQDTPLYKALHRRVAKGK